MKLPEINGNIITLFYPGAYAAAGDAVARELESYSVMRDGNIWSLSFPMSSKNHAEFAGAIHQYNAKQKVDKKRGKPDNEPTPPKPTNPRGSGGKVLNFEKTIAIAA